MATKRKKYIIPEIGQTFGDWTVINNTNVSTDPKKGKYVTVQCKCGYTNQGRLSTLYRGESTQCLGCRGQASSKKYFKGIGQLTQSYVYHTQKSAESRGIPFELSKEQLWDLFVKQDGKCALSNLELCFYKNYKNKSEQTASIDRIDSSKGYTIDNVQWIHKHINYMKVDFNQSQFIELCDLVSKHKKTEPRIRVVARTTVEGIHRWFKCPIEEVSYLRDYHRHVFHIHAKAYVNHTDRDIEFIKLSHDIKQYLTDKYYSEKYKCLFFDDSSCEMIADELVKKFELYECEVNEDGEGGSIVRNI